jgi:2-hydroxychromene-2-carboxylate isomerase
MTLAFDLYWSFRSPYSYLATPRLRALADEWDVDVRVRPVLPIAVRIDGFFDRQNPLWVPYLLRDVVRVAEFNGMKIAWPMPDPVVQDMATRSVPKEQPYIHRLTRLGVLAAEAGRGLPFLDEVSRTLWGGTVQRWHEGSHLAEAANRAGLDLAELDAKAGAEAPRLDATISENQKALEAGGHWGVPTMVFENEPFFGQDRLELLVWRMKKRGLAPRARRS